jgi:hypothetical protein
MDPDNEIPWKRFIGIGDRMRSGGSDRRFDADLTLRATATQLRPGRQSRA